MGCAQGQITEVGSRATMEVEGSANGSAVVTRLGNGAVEITSDNCASMSIEAGSHATILASIICAVGTDSIYLACTEGRIITIEDEYITLES